MQCTVLHIDKPAISCKWVYCLDDDVVISWTPSWVNLRLYNANCVSFLFVRLFADGVQFHIIGGVFAVVCPTSGPEAKYGLYEFRRSNFPEIVREMTPVCLYERMLCHARCTCCIAIILDI